MYWSSVALLRCWTLQANVAQDPTHISGLGAELSAETLVPVAAAVLDVAVPAADYLVCACAGDFTTPHSFFQDLLRPDLSEKCVVSRAKDTGLYEGNSLLHTFTPESYRQMVTQGVQVPFSSVSSVGTGGIYLGRSPC